MTELLNLSLRESADSLWRELNSAWSPPFWHFPQLKAADEGRNRDWTLNWQLWFYSFRKVMVPISSPNTKYIHKFVFWLCNPSYRELVYFLWLCLKLHDVQEKNLHHHQLLPLTGPGVLQPGRILTLVSLGAQVIMKLIISFLSCS